MLGMLFLNLSKYAEARDSLKPSQVAQLSCKTGDNMRCPKRLTTDWTNLALRQREVVWVDVMVSYTSSGPQAK